MIELTSKQRKVLEKAAHHLEPIIIVGQNGVTPATATQVSNAFKTHELLKVKFNEFKDDKRELAQWLSQETDSTVVRIIGNVLTLYHPFDDVEKREFKI